MKKTAFSDSSDVSIHLIHMFMSQQGIVKLIKAGVSCGLSFARDLLLSVEMQDEEEEDEEPETPGTSKRNNKVRVSK